jgi:hypothetical protein
MSWKAVAEIERQALIQQKSSCDSGEQRLLRFLKRLNCLLTRDCWKLPQELAQRMATLDVVDQVLERNSRAPKAGRSVHDLRVDYNCGLYHGRFPLYRPAANGKAGGV